MEHKGIFQKFCGVLSARSRSRILIAIGLSGVAAISLTLGMRVGISPVPTASSGDLSGEEVSRPSLLSRVAHRYGSLLVDIQNQVEELERADEENDQLRAENAHLRLVIESERFEREERKARATTRSLELKLHGETGSRAGRTLASIPYQIPRDLMPGQLYELGLRYFHSGDNERAAVLLTFLTGLESDSTFRTPDNFLLTGICWYRLENYELADLYFDKAMKAPEAKSDSALQSQLRLWRALDAQRLKNHRLAQRWLRDLLNFNPHAKEAAWVNPDDKGFRELHPDEVKREPAENSD